MKKKFIRYLHTVFGVVLLSTPALTQTTHPVSVKIDQSICTPLSISKELDIRIYPNPVEEYINFQSTSNILDVVVLDLLGREMKNFKSVKSKPLYLGDLRAGVYVVRILVESKDQYYSFKIRRK